MDPYQELLKSATEIHDAAELMKKNAEEERRIRPVLHAEEVRSRTEQKSLLQNMMGLLRQSGSAASGALAKTGGYLGLGGLGQMASGITEGRIAPMSSFGKVGQVGSAVMGAAGGALTAFAGAAGAAVSSISQLTSTVTNFVSAISPSIVQALGRAMHDLNAAIGQAFTGAMEEAVGYVRELGAIINPLAQEFQPVIRQFAEIMRSLAVPYIELYATVLRAMMPAFQLFADLLQAVVPVLQAYMVILAAVVKTLGQWIGSLFGDGMKTAVKSLQDALMNLAKFIVLAFARIAQFFGMTNLLKNLEDQLRGGKRESAEGKGVGSNPQQQDFMAYARQALLAGLTSGPMGEDKKTERDYLKELAETLKQVREGQSDAIATALNDARDKLVAIIAQGVRSVFTESGLGQFITSVNGAITPQSTVGALATAALGPAGMAANLITSSIRRR